MADKHDYFDRTTVAGKRTDRAGKQYSIMLDGSIRRDEPKEWANKKERRRVMKQRRLDQA
ncbi:MAG: hypothetical protein EBU46_13555 [Nitrosomonadaceae bacterium]|nr:hypothetical protein [Nitrosomonadaceae bacterium]